MKKTIYLGDFRDAFTRAGRKQNFSYEGLEVLFDYLEEIYPEYELDVIEICCEYEEMTLEEVNEAYGKEFETLDDAAKWLNESTIVCGQTDSSIIFAAYSQWHA